MSILKELRHTLQKGAEVKIYGTSAARRSSRIQMLHQPGSAYDYVAEAGRIYDNGVVLPAINLKANAVSECDLIIEKREQSGVWVRASEQGQVKAALDAIETPNPYYDGSLLFRGAQLSWDCRGQWFLLKRRDRLGRCIGFYWCPHFQIRPLADTDNMEGTKLVTRYEYQPMNGPIQYLAVSDVVQIRMGIDPYDWASGLSPLASTLRDICADNEASNWLASILRNRAMPGVIISPKGQNVPLPTDDQKQAFKELWQSFTHDKRGEALMAPIAFDVFTPEFSPQQMELGKLREIPTGRILAALGLDPMALGLPSENKTYANYSEAMDAAGKMTILPAIRSWAKQMGQSILPDFQLDPRDYRFSWDVSRVSWLIDETDQLHKRVRDDFRAGVISRARAKELIGEKPLPEDEEVYATAKVAAEPPIQDDKE